MILGVGGRNLIYGLWESCQVSHAFPLMDSVLNAAATSQLKPSTAQWLAHQHTPTTPCPFPILGCKPSNAVNYIRLNNPGPSQRLLIRRAFSYPGQVVWIERLISHDGMPTERKQEVMKSSQSNSNTIHNPCWICSWILYYSEIFFRWTCIGPYRDGV